MQCSVLVGRGLQRTRAGIAARPPNDDAASSGPRGAAVRTVGKAPAGGIWVVRVARPDFFRCAGCPPALMPPPSALSNIQSKQLVLARCRPSSLTDAAK